MSLSIKPTHKPVKDYYSALKEFEKHGVTKETSVRNAFQELLTTYARKKGWTFIEEHGITLKNKNKGSVDGVITDAWTTPMGYWEAKDSNDDLKKEIKSKFDKGYPRTNILFQEPKLAVLYQDGVLVNSYDLTDAEKLVSCLEDFFGYKADEEENWDEIVQQFKDRIPDSAKQLISMIEVEKKENKKFRDAFSGFAELCRASINPNLAEEAMEEMLVQHLLTSRIFETVFDNPEFVRRNVIANEIEKVIDALTIRKFSRKDFFAPLDHFYRALENRAKSITDWSQKQSFLNAVYEKFFQGFAVKVADTHGIVYTPQPIVDFMVKSVEHILRTEFNRSLADEGVHILDPFVGTGNFIMRIMREIGETQKTKLPKKYKNELHCNEVMLLPYYIASMNIEHEYYQQTGEYKSFEGICLVDTFELAEPAQTSLFTTENTERVERQKRLPIFVAIGNPPYNAGQADENDNNKNRKYPVIDSRVEETYARDSRTKLKIRLNDPYVKAFRFASDRIQKTGEGIVCLVSNNSFVDSLAFDGVRKHMREEFESVYVLDLGGNVRRNPKLSGTTHNVFGIQVGVAITLLVKNPKCRSGINYARLDEWWTKRERLKYLNDHESIKGIDWINIFPDKNENWLTSELQDDFESLLKLGEKDRTVASSAIFDVFSNCLRTNRDAWAYNFNAAVLSANIQRTINFYNQEVSRFAHAEPKPKNVDNFVSDDDSQIKWSGDLKTELVKGKVARFDSSHILPAIYRPFTREYVYLDRLLNNSVYQLPKIFPISGRESQNLAITVTIPGSEKPFMAMATTLLPDFHLPSPGSGGQCFPFYTYDEDGSNRKENITDWALKEFQTKLKDKKITKWEIFYYVYGILHHPEYRTKYAANLRRELPRIPISKDFWAFASAGKKLANMHVHYEDQPEYRLGETWRKGAGLNLRVQKMKLSKDKRDLIYNEDLTLTGIPPETFDYRLGNRSALDWIIDQYQVSTDKRSGITNDPNREDDDTYILRLIKKVITVSVETVKVVKEIEGLGIEDVKC